MPGLAAAIEYLQQLQRKGRNPNAPFHIVDIEQEAEARKKNDGPKPKTRFQIELDDPELYKEWNASKDRIIRRCGNNKAIALTLMQRAWDEALSDPQIDKLLAEQEGIDAT